MGLLVWMPLINDIKNQGTKKDIIPKFMGSGVTFATGKIGNAATFPNVASSCIYMDGLKLQTGSWCAWIKVFGEGSGTSQRIISEGRDTGSVGTNIYVNKAGTTLYIKSHKTGLDTTIELNKWYHVAMTFGDGILKMYINGVMVRSTTYSNDSDYAQSNDSLVLGKMSYGYTSSSNYFPFNGQLNDFRAYDNALSEQEIKKISQGLVLHLPLSRKGFGQDNLVKGTSTDLVIPTENTYTARSSGSNKLFTMDAKQLLLEACDKGLTLSYDIHCPGAYKNTSASLNRLGCYANFSIKDNTTGETKAFYGHHSIAGTATDKNTYSKTNSLNAVSANATAENPDTSFNGHYSRTIWPKQNATVNAFYNNPDNYTVTVNQVRTEIVGVYIKEETWIKNIHLEFGDKETPWSPHAEDTIYSALPISNTTAYDISGYQHNAIMNNITYSTDTPFNEMCSVFNGSNSYVKVNDNTWMVDKADAITVNYWAYASNWASVTNGGRMVSCTESGGFNLEGGSTGYIRFPRYVYTNAEQTSKSYQYSNTGIKLADLTAGWHMFTLVYNTSGEKIYIDGTLHSEASYTSYGLCFNKGARLFLGCEASGASPTSPYFNGRMSDYRIYYTTLSADDVRDLYEKR